MFGKLKAQLVLSSVCGGFGSLCGAYLCMCDEDADTDVCVRKNMLMSAVIWWILQANSHKTTMKHLSMFNISAVCWFYTIKTYILTSKISPF